MLSFIILGREAGLAFAEIYQFLGGGRIEQASREAVIVRDADLGDQAAQILGGVPKSGIILHKTDTLSPELLADMLRPYIIVGKKFHFGISLYNASSSTSPTTPSPSSGRRGLNGKSIGLAIKKILKQAGFSVRLVESKSDNLSSVDVVKNKLLSSGVELCIFVTDHGYLVGKTEAVQPFEDYSRRDYGRPARDIRSGMLPPKVAKMMINIAAGARGDTETQSVASLLDPFCGSGTILQEALLAGHNVIGADISDKAVADSRRNLEWLASSYANQPTKACPRLWSGVGPQFFKADPALAGNSGWRVEPMDARQIGGLIKPKSVDVIVSEFHLGPPLSGREGPSQIAAVEKQLSALYRQALPSLAQALKDNGRAVFAWPYFKRQDVFISAFAELSRLGWEVIEPYPAEYQTTFPLSRRGTLFYGRPDQRVWREILILAKG